MTGNIFADICLIFLCVYAVVHICYEVGDYLVETFSNYRHREFLILLLSPQNEGMETDVRVAVKRSEKLRCCLLIVDLGLSPKELQILYRLTDSYSHVLILSEGELSPKIREAGAINEAL